jgi:hypothetical protein
MHQFVDQFLDWSYSFAAKLSATEESRCDVQGSWCCWWRASQPFLQAQAALPQRLTSTAATSPVRRKLRNTSSRAIRTDWMPTTTVLPARTFLVRVQGKAADPRSRRPLLRHRSSTRTPPEQPQRAERRSSYAETHESTVSSFEVAAVARDIESIAGSLRGAREAGWRPPAA